MTHLRCLAVSLSIALTLIALPLSAVAQTTPSPTTVKSTAVDPKSSIPLDEIRRYVQVYQAIKQAYVEPVDDHELMQSAVRGLVRSLDPHSVYFDKKDADAFDEHATGRYEGIGVEVQTQADGSILIVAPLDGSPAKKAGVKSMDRIVAVNGVSLIHNDKQSEVDLRGPAGTTVTITIIRKGVKAPLKLTVARDAIKNPSVEQHVLEPGYGYLRVAEFQADSATDFETAIGTLLKQGVRKGVVLDLRSNPGGLLNAAVQMADDLLDKGGIVSTRGRLPDGDTRFDATPGDLLRGMPVVVLVDVGSASASEVLAGALKDNHRALIVGSRTFGKGSVQTLLPLDNGDSVKITTARYYTPSGQSIQAIGIAPDVQFKANSAGIVHDEIGYSEVSLPNHIGATTRQPIVSNTTTDPGDLLEGDGYIAQALKVLKGPSK